MPLRSSSSACNTGDCEVSTEHANDKTKEALIADSVEKNIPSTDVTDIDPHAKLPVTLSTSIPRPSSTRRSIDQLPSTLTRNITRLLKKDFSILHKKKKRLREHGIDMPPIRNGVDMSNVVNATLVFAQEDAGTAVCISPHGILLTCSHCVAESTEELENNRTKWLLFASGEVVKADCVAWDPTRDLSLLQIVACQRLAETGLNSPSSSSPSAIPLQGFPFLIPADAPLPFRAALTCVGHPGSEDLEASKPGIKTNYNVLHVSSGNFRGYAPGQDRQDNSEIGALMHDCWTYWGHSGAPLVEQSSGRLAGLHSSWDDQTGMRRGVGLEAIKAFLNENAGLFRYEDIEGLALPV
ncbi:trypsin-like cysteine/serine peptidase domain-containing protein [Gymnopilus junonius]|uniref:Trypsin-like cysteine/serine peptidase domain-containing protein n=1 Tax=Gymnopilus junonius TaxID=109634 RepID=A0A9P5TMH2_GYMJU|nr:trypsin-like cysteine/serine peptidase domain-containing protein [Gymnopilus junonius]